MAEAEPNYSKLEFPFLPLPTTFSMHYSPEHYPSGMATPPLQSTLASVPFKWEEQPGKPRPCTDIIGLPEPVKLGLPPCGIAKMTKMPSPTTVLDGPYNIIMNKDVGRSSRFSSFRFFREANNKESSFESSSYASPESAVDVLLRKKKSTRGFFGRRLKFYKGGSKGFEHGGSFGFSSCSVNGYDDSDDQMCEEIDQGKKKMRRNASVSTRARSSTHLCASVYQSLKQVIPWKSIGKSKKDGSV